MKKLLFIAFVLVTIVSCNKDQKAVKTLDGKWAATSFVVTEGLVSIDFLELGISYEMQFTNCKLKDEETCDVIITSSDGDDTEKNNGQYRVFNDGTSMELLNIDGQSSDLLTIEELSKSKLILTLIDGDLDATITLEKQ